MKVTWSSQLFYHPPEKSYHDENSQQASPPPGLTAPPDNQPGITSVDSFAGSFRKTTTSEAADFSLSKYSVLTSMGKEFGKEWILVWV